MERSYCGRPMLTRRRQMAMTEAGAGTMARLKTLWALLGCAVRHWSADQAATLGAALAFYCAFSLAPLLVILVSVAGFFIGAEMAYGHIESQLGSLFGSSTAKILLEAMQSSQRDEGIFATVLSIGTLLLGATT